MGWNYFSILKIQQCNCWSLGMGTWFIQYHSSHTLLGMWLVTHACERGPSDAVWHHTVYPKKYAHGFVVLCFVVVMQSFIMNSHEVFIHIHQGCFAGTGAIVRLPQCQWSKPDGYGKISQCITTTKHSKAKTVCIFLGIYCTCWSKRIQVIWYLKQNTIIFIQGNAIEIAICEMVAVLSRPEWVWKKWMTGSN